MDMYEIKSTAKKATKTQSKKQTVDHKEIVNLFAKAIGGLFLLGTIAFGAYKLLQEPPVPIWNNYNETLSTGDTILHQQAISIKNITLEYTMNNNPKDSMALSIKKIDGKDAVWLVGSSNDFLCVGTVSQKCSLDISFDGKNKKSYGYDGGTMRTAYIHEATDLINQIKISKEITVSSKFKRPELTPTEKSNIATANGGRYIDYINKEHTFKVEGLIWN